MFHLDDQYLKETESEARKTGKVLEKEALDQEFRAMAAQLWSEHQERQLVVAAQKGDADAFANLFRHHWGRLWMLCDNIVGRKGEDSEDVAQSVLIRAWEKLDTFNTHYMKFGPWLFRIAVNICIDRLRRRDRDIERLGEALSLEEPIWDDNVEETLGMQLPDKEAIDPAEEVALRVTLEESWPKCWSGLTSNEQISLILIYRWGGEFKDLGWMIGAKRIEPNDGREARKKRYQSAHNTGKYHVAKALRKLERCLRAGGLDLTPSQVWRLVEKQENKGGDVQ